MIAIKTMKSYLQRNFKYIVFAYFIILIVIKFLLATRLPAYILSDNAHDDLWTVKAAESILAGNWLGNYDQYTLIKGCFAPLLMAFTNRIGATYLSMYTFLYCTSCVVFVKAVQPILKSVVHECLLFTFLLFNPVTMAAETFQRIYRNGHSQWQLLLVFGAIFAVYIRREWSIKKILPWAILGGISLWAFYNTREDAVWLMPFCIVAIVVTVISLIFGISKQLSAEKGEKKNTTLKSIVVVLPLMILLIGNTVVKSVNYMNYGAFLSNDRTKGSFSEVIKDLYAIEPAEGLIELYSDPNKEYAQYYYNIYHDVLYKAYEASPTFNSVYEQVEAAIAQWDSGEALVDGELMYDHVLYAIRDGVAAAGYYSDLKTSSEFYERVHLELQEAFDNGTLEKRDALFYTNITPLKDGDVSKIIHRAFDMIKQVITLPDVYSYAVPATGRNIMQFVNFTNNTTVYPVAPWTQLSGWAFADDKFGDVKIFFCREDGTRIVEVICNESVDIYDYFMDYNYTCENAKCSRFNVNIDNIRPEEVVLLCYYDGNDNLLASYHFQTENSFEGDFRFNLDSITSSQKSNINGDSFQPFVDRCNRVIDVYRFVQPILFILGCVAFLYIIMRVIVLIYKRQSIPQELISALLILSGLLLSIVVFVFAIAYVGITSFPTWTYLYLSSAYIMVLMFIGLGCITGINDIMMLINCHNDAVRD